MWTAKEERELRRLTLSPSKNPRKKLQRLVRHFRDGGTVWAVTDPLREEPVSRGLARKVRSLTQAGELSWLLGGGLKPTRPRADIEKAWTVAPSRPTTDPDSEQGASRDPALVGHLNAIVRGVTSGQAAAIMNIESPAHVIGYGPGNVRIRERTEAFRKWASSRQMVHAAEHAIKLDIPAQLVRYRTAVNGYIEAMKLLEDRAIDQARELGLVWERDEDHKQEVFTDDFWGVPLRWAVGTRLGHRIEVPRATVVHDNPGGESAGGGLYRLYWLYDSSMRSIAASESREVMSKAESAFLAWGDRWLRGAGITALSDSFHRAQAVMQRLHEVILSLTVDDLAEGRCTDCPSTA